MKLFGFNFDDSSMMTRWCCFVAQSFCSLELIVLKLMDAQKFLCAVLKIAYVSQSNTAENQ